MPSSLPQRPHLPFSNHHYPPTQKYELGRMRDFVASRKLSLGDPQVPPPQPLPNPAEQALFEAMFDEEAGEGVFSDSDEEDIYHINAAPYTEGPATEENGQAALVTPTDGFESLSSNPSPEEVDDSRGAGSSKPSNKIAFALTYAVEHYPSRSRPQATPHAPSPSSSSSSSPSPKTPPDHPAQLESDSPSSTPEFVDDNSDDDSVYSSDGECKKKEFLLNRPNFSRQQAETLLYKPTGTWSRFAHEPIENPVVIAKFHPGLMCDATIKCGTIKRRPITYVSKTWALTQTWRGFFSEMLLYSHPSYLRSLQGRVVPRIIGMYLVDGAISVAMELPSSTFWVEASDDMSNHLKRKCIAAFEEIHARGVVHGDVELRHMLISAEGKVTIIDFQESKALDPAPDVGLKRATEDDIRLEMRKVKFKLDYDGARAKEVEKYNRVGIRRHQLEERATRLRRGLSVNPINEIEPEHPDDILNPVVNSTIFLDCWVGSAPDPICYIVPGRDEAEVSHEIQCFLSLELDRQESEKAASEAPASTENPHLQVSDSGEDAMASSAASSSLQQDSPTSRREGKRKRSDEDDADEGTRPSKKTAMPAATDGPVAGPSTQTAISTSSGLPFVAEPEEEAASEEIPTVSPDAANVIYVPFETYDGPGGFTIPNIFSAQQIAELRRIWIMQYSVARCKEENLPYPLAERLELAASTEEKVLRVKNGKVRKRKPITSRGALKRLQLESSNPGQRKKEAEERKAQYLKHLRAPELYNEKEAGPSTVIEEEDDGIDEGPQIVSWSELPESERGRTPRFVEPGSPRSTGPLHLPPASKPSTPLKGCMRRQLSPESKAMQREYQAWIDARSKPKPGRVNKKYLKPSPTKRVRVLEHPPPPPPSSSSGSSSASTSSSTTVCAPTEDNLKKLNDLNPSGYFDRESSPDSDDSNVTSNPYINAAESRSHRRSRTRRRRSFSPAASDTATVGGAHIRMYELDDWDLSQYQPVDQAILENLDPRVAFGAYIPLEERESRPDNVSEEDIGDQDEIEQLVGEERRGWMESGAGWMKKFKDAFSGPKR